MPHPETLCERSVGLSKSPLAFVAVDVIFTFIFKIIRIDRFNCKMLIGVLSSL